MKKFEAVSLRGTVVTRDGQEYVRVPGLDRDIPIRGVANCTREFEERIQAKYGLKKES